ncbi:hypothetical protein [Pedobacter steynii]
MTIRWVTNKLCYSWIEYGEGKDLNSKGAPCNRWFGGRPQQGKLC